jgi:hypothetical protein
MNLSSFTAPWTVRALRSLLLLGVGGCSAPVTPYAPAQLLPVPAGRPAESSRSLAGSRLCQGVGSDWDSVLVVLPYTPPATVRALGLTNYGAISGPVARQKLNEGTCTLLLVKNERFTAYSVFPRTVDWVGFSRDKAPQQQLVWLTKPDCARLVAKFRPVAGDTITGYTVGLSPAQ